MWSEKFKLRVTRIDMLIFAGVGQRAVVLANPGPSRVRLHSGGVGITIERGLVGALTMNSDIYVQLSGDEAEAQDCDVQFAISGT